MLKKDFIKLYSEHNKLKESIAEEEVERFINVLGIALSMDSKIIFRKFGSFEVRKTKERMIVDPKNQKEKILLHAKPRKYVKFKVSRSLEENLFLKEE